MTEISFFDLNKGEFIGFPKELELNLHVIYEYPKMRSRDMIDTPFIYNSYNMDEMQNRVDELKSEVGDDIELFRRKVGELSTPDLNIMPTSPSPIDEYFLVPNTTYRVFFDKGIVVHEDAIDKIEDNHLMSAHAIFSPHPSIVNFGVIFNKIVSGKLFNPVVKTEIKNEGYFLHTLFVNMYTPTSFRIKRGQPVGIYEMI